MYTTVSLTMRPLRRNPLSVPEDELILVNERNRAIGTATKQSVHERGLLHRAFSIFLVDNEGRVLLQRRHPGKYHSGGLWSNSCCGHPRPGERTLQAARRRLGEELGATSPLRFGFQARYRASFPNGLHENEMVSVYFGRVPSALTPNPEEVVALKSCTLAELEAAIREHPEQYSYWLKYYVADHASALAGAVAAIGDHKRGSRPQAGLTAPAVT